MNKIHVNITLKLTRHRVEGKKIVSLPRFSLSPSPFIMREMEQNFIPNPLQQLEFGATKLCVYKMTDTVDRKRAC